jgi:hypothetical protein
MRFATPDESFVLELVGHGGLFFRITLLLGDRALGDGEPEYGPQTLVALRAVPTALDPRLDSSLPPAVLLRILRDDTNHDRHNVQLGEGFDGWEIRGFVRDGYVVIVFQDSRTDPPGQPHVQAIREEDFFAVIDNARAFYIEQAAQ